MPVTPPIATLDELKAQLDVARTDDDVPMQAALDGVCQRVENYTGRRFRPDPPLTSENPDADTQPAVTRKVRLPRHHWRRWLRYPDWEYPRTLKVDIPDAREIDSIVGTQVTFTGFEPLDDPPYRRVELYGVQYPFQSPVTQLPELTVTGRFGIYPAPADLKDAVLFMAARRWKERDAVYGDTVQFPDGGPVVSYFRQFPPAVQATLELYIRKVRLV